MRLQLRLGLRFIFGAGLVLFQLATQAEVCRMRKKSAGVHWLVVLSRRAWALLVPVWFVMVAADSPAADEPTVLPSNQSLWETAAERIEKYRKGNLVVKVHDEQGRPVDGAKVTVQQTRHKFLFGCNVFLWGRTRSENEETLYRRRFCDLFNYATLPFYWFSYERVRGRTQYQRVRAIALWCRDHGITPKGHPLAWNYADPPWLPDDPELVRQLQYQRVENCVSQFRGLIDYWDVVNEATKFDRPAFWKRAPKLTRMWQQTGRVKFTAECFRRARKANPQATLLINDYRVDEQYKKIIQQLKDEQGRPLFDVIGIQSHMHAGTWSNQKIWEVCERFACFGVPLHFTETTILSASPKKHTRNRHQGRGQWVTTPDGEQWQAKEVERFYTLLFSHPAVEAVTWWDFSDQAAWQGAPAGLLRKDMSPKPAYQRLLELVKKRWWTNPTTQTTSRTGTCSFRVFLGEYQISVELPNGRRLTRSANVVHRGTTTLSVQVTTAL